MGKDEAVQHDAGTTWSVPGSQAEPQDAVAPPGGPETSTGLRARPAPLDDAPRTGDPTFAAAGPLTRRSGQTDGVDVPAVRMQPMTVADILDGAFAIIKARPARLLGLAAVFVVPVHLLIAYLQRDAPGLGLYWDSLTANDPAVRAEATEQTSSTEEFWLGLMVMFLPTLALVFVAAAIAHLVAAWSAGRDVTFGQLLGVVGRRWWALLVSFVAIHVLEVVGCYIGTLFVMAAFVVTAPVIGAEGLGPFKAMGRSVTLTMRRFWPVLGISLLIGVVAILLGNALGGLPSVVAYFLDFELAWMILAAGSAAGAVIATPFVAAATVLLYLDLRIRTEGLDIELAAIDMAKQAPNAG
ncbi:MAG: hypothetical protein ACRD2C_16685 [Acidimicrobiales bacterium]